MQTYAFVLESAEKGEYDRAYSLLTKDLGVIDAFSKSVRKSGSKLSGHLEPPNFCWMELIESMRGWQIASALEEKNFREIIGSPGALRTILQAGFLMKEFIPVSHPDDALWELWREFVAHLTARAASYPAAHRGILAQFLIKLMAQLGFFPDPTDLAPAGRLRENLSLILKGAWLEGKAPEDPALWEITKSAVGTARRLMI